MEGVKMPLGLAIWSRDDRPQLTVRDGIHSGQESVWDQHKEGCAGAQERGLRDSTYAFPHFENPEPLHVWGADSAAVMNYKGRVREKKK